VIKVSKSLDCCATRRTPNGRFRERHRAALAVDNWPLWAGCVELWAGCVEAEPTSSNVRLYLFLQR
jgi:hypothetical protein